MSAQRKGTVRSLLLSAALVVGSSQGIGATAEPQGARSLAYRVETPTYQLEAGRLVVPGYETNDVPGAPALPIWSALVELPDGVTDWYVRIEDSDPRDVSVSTLLSSVPVPGPISDLGPGPWDMDELPDSVPLQDAPDPDIYQVDELYPSSTVQVGEAVTQRGRRLLPVRVFPFQYNPVRGFLLFHPDLTITIEFSERAPVDGAPSSAAWPEVGGESPLNPAASPQFAAGALRLYTSERGMHHVTYDDVSAEGVDPSDIDPATLAVTYLGDKVDVEVIGGGDGTFDSGDEVVFYAEPYHGRYMTQNVYWLTYGGASSPQMEERTTTPVLGEPEITTITQTLHIEYDRSYYSAYARPKDADHWFDTQLYPTVSVPTQTVTYTLGLDDALTAGEVQITALLHGGVQQAANPDQSVLIRLNTHDVGTYQWEGSTDYTATATVSASWLDAAPNGLGLEAATSQLGSLSYKISPDWVDFSYPAVADAELDRIYIEGTSSGANERVVTGFTTETVSVYDVRAPLHPERLMTTSAVDEGASYSIHFWDDDLSEPSYWLTSDAALLSPASIVVDTSSAWGTTSNDYDYIAIVHSSLYTATVPLLDHRESDGFRVARVDVQDVYDEFSYGRTDPEAIRDFLSYAYHNWNHGGTPPAYVLLVGDGHYDFKGVSTTYPNLIPPYLLNVDPWLGETAADNRFVSVDGEADYMPDMHIGRIPARTAADVTAAVDKILAYETYSADSTWQKHVVYVADNCLDAAGNFHALSDDIRNNWLPRAYDDQIIYYSSSATCTERTGTTATEMRNQIKAAFNSGAFSLQWFGHGSSFRWGSVSMFNIYDPPALSASSYNPITFAFACWSGYFINIVPTGTGQALGEILLLTPGRSSVGDVSPTGLHIGDALLKMDRGVTKSLYQDRTDRFGDAVDAARLYFYQNSFSWHDLIDTTVLFGDPALKLRLPKQPQAPVVAIDASGTSADLSWSHIGIDVDSDPINVPQYQVWSSTSPYFLPEDSGSTLITTTVVISGTLPGDPLGYLDGSGGGTIGNPDINNFYVVQAMSPIDFASTESNHTGEFDFVLVPGS